MTTNLIKREYKPQGLKPIHYQCRTGNPHNLRFAVTKMRWASCPYHMVHAKIKGRFLGDLLFEKWSKRPIKAKELYWRLHPEEVKAIDEYYANLRKK